MKIKTFDEFLETITEEDWNNMLVKANDAVNSYKSSNLPTKFNDMVLLQGVMLLRRYHEWLSEQFDQTSLN